jgi:hypothetical protein
LAKVQADITKGGGHAMFITGDVTKFADIEPFGRASSRPTVWSTCWHNVADQ